MNPGRKSLSYFKTFLSFILIVLAACTILVASLYINYERHSTKLVQTYTSEELSQISYSTNFMFETARSTLIQLYSDPSVLTLMNYDNLDNMEIASLLTKIGTTNFNMPFVNSIYIYNKSAGKIYNADKMFDVDQFPDQDIVRRIQDSKKMKWMSPIARQIPSPADYTNIDRNSKQTDDVYTFVFYDKDQGANEIDSAIVLNVSQEWLKNTIQSMNPGTSDEILIVDANGQITFGNSDYRYLDSLGKHFNSAKILDSNHPSGNVVEKINGKSCSISYVSTSMLDWKCIRITPLAVISGKFKQILLISLLIFFVVTSLAILATLFSSKKTYSFFNRKISDLEKRHIADKNGGYTKKQQFLRTFALQGTEEHERRRKFLQYDIRFDCKKRFLAIVLRIDRYQTFCRNYSIEDRELFTYGFINIINELAGVMFIEEAVDLGEGRIAVLFNLDDSDYENLITRIADLVHSIQKKTREYLDFSFYASVGDILSDVSEFPESIAESMESVDYSLFYGMNPIIYASNMGDIKKKTYRVPTQNISGLIDNLLLEKNEAVAEGCRQIVDSTRGYSITCLQNTIFQLVMQAKAAIERNGYFVGEAQYAQCIDSINHLNRFESVEEFIERLHAFFETLAAEISQSRESLKKNDRGAGLLESVEDYLSKEYAHPNLNPERIAGQFGLSSKYLCEIYKKAAGESLVEKINRYRLEKSKYFLESTGTSANEIAAKVGFSSITYFYTVFKKYNGITPNEYRSLKANLKTNEAENQ